MFNNIDLSHYHMATLEQYKKDFPSLSENDAEKDWLETFLIQTDYEVMKATEQNLLGNKLDEETKNIISARVEARARINELEEVHS